MKIAGKHITRPSALPLVIPRADGDIVLKFNAVLDFDEFDTLHKKPNPPVVFHKDGTRSLGTEDPTFKEELDKWARHRTTWTLLKSLEGTEGLEFEIVNINDPSTYTHLDKELRDAGFSVMEIGKMYETAFTACGLDDSKIEEATRNFLRTRSDRAS